MDMEAFEESGMLEEQDTVCLQHFVSLFWLGNGFETQCIFYKGR